jgi:hypothetical protein
MVESVKKPASQSSERRDVDREGNKWPGNVNRETLRELFARAGVVGEPKDILLELRRFWDA